MSIKSRLRDFLNLNHISKMDFYKTVHVANGYLDKDSAVNSDVLASIMVKYPKINMRWLLLGIGNMYNESKEEIKPTSLDKNSCDEKCQLKDYIIELQRDKIKSLEAQQNLIMHA